MLTRRIRQRVLLVISLRPRFNLPICDRPLRAVVRLKLANCRLRRLWSSRVGVNCNVDLPKCRIRWFGRARYLLTNWLELLALLRWYSIGTALGYGRRGAGPALEIVLLTWLHTVPRCVALCRVVSGSVCPAVGAVSPTRLSAGRLW